MSYPEKHFFTLGVGVFKKSPLGIKKQKTVLQSIKTVKKTIVANKVMDRRLLGVKKKYFKHIGG